MATKPVKNGRITSEFGWRINPFDKSKKEWHPGIDIAPPLDGSDPHPEIFNVWKSIVTVLGTSTSYGERVWVKLMDGPHKDFFMIYPHMLKINPELRIGMIIEEGMLIGLMGTTGKSTGIHTHLGIQPSMSPGNAINPVEIRAMYV